jgi:hypothetical protein
VVVLIAPESYVPPEELAYDTTRDATGANIGDTWDGAQYVQPVVEVPPVLELARADFRRRFTPAEAWAAKDLAKTDPTMAYGMDLFSDVQVVHLQHPDTLQYVGYMQSKGILSAERAQAILAG